MLKKVMFGWLILLTVVKFGSLSVLLSIAPGHLPIPVYISTGFLALLGLGLICKRILGWISRRMLIAYIVLEFVSVLFNLIFVKVATRIEVSTLDLAVIGTLLNLLVDCILLFQARRQRVRAAVK